jgi:hypothetical protein
MEIVTRYQQKRWGTPSYSFAPRATKVTEYFFPREKIIMYTDGQRLLSTEAADSARLSVHDHDNDRETCAAENVEEVRMDEGIYATVVEWHRVKSRARELQGKLEDAFFYDEGDF